MSYQKLRMLNQIITMLANMTQLILIVKRLVKKKRKLSKHCLVYLFLKML